MYIHKCYLTCNKSRVMPVDPATNENHGQDVSDVSFCHVNHHCWIYKSSKTINKYTFTISQISFLLYFKQCYDPTIQEISSIGRLMFKVHTVTLIFVRFIEILWSFFCGWLHRTKGISTVYPKWPSFNLLAPLYGPTFDTNPSKGFIIPKRHGFSKWCILEIPYQILSVWDFISVKRAFL